MTKILINYAHNKFYQSQEKNVKSGLRNGFDKAFSYRFENLDFEFVNRNSTILSQPRGAGYWIWKAQILLQTFHMCNEGDYVMYADSGSEFISNIDPLISICDTNDGILLFHLTPDPGNCEQIQTKRDAFILMGCEHVKDMWPVLHAGFQLYKNCSNARNFVQDYLYFCQDPRIVTDLPNEFGENFPLFQNHRHDQSVLSCLQKMKGIKSYLDITQFGNSFRQPSDTYGQIINHTRNQN